MGALVKPKLTPEQYLEIERPAEYRHDFLDGDMFEMPGATRYHSRININLMTALTLRLRGTSYSNYAIDMRVQTVPGRHFTYPDQVIVREDPATVDLSADIIDDPIAVFEVLMPPTELYDRVVKFDLYFQVDTFREYVLVTHDRIRVERYLRRGPGEWSLTVLTEPTAILRMQSLPIEIALSEIYENVELPTEYASFEFV